MTRRARLEQTMAFAHPEFLVSTDWLAEHLADDDVRVFESTVFLRRDDSGFRVEPGRGEYESGHIPGAGFLDLQGDFSDNDHALRFMMPSAEAFAEAAGRHGISETSRLVLYDRAGSSWAARLWWMFRSMGCERVAVLDGGWRRWADEGRAVSTDEATYEPTTFTPTADPARFADLAEVRAFIEAGDGRGSCLINALSREQHAGADGGGAYGRPGHIPGAVNVPAMELTDPDTGLYLPAEELAAAFEQAGADRAQRVVTYCGGGIAASNDAFVLSLLGYEDVAVYDASMSEYAADPSLPLEVA
ncbi:MAG: sulfurtransferase [Chloroflexi bacterium]|nr:sulfurtransferase [Chloroflexota bacterium]